MLRYATEWKSRPRRHVYYEGEIVARNQLRRSGFDWLRLDRTSNPSQSLLVLGRGAGASVDSSEVAKWRERGGQILAVEAASDDIALSGTNLSVKTVEHIAAFFQPGPFGSWRAGIGPADVHNRDPRAIPLAVAGGEVVGDGVIARSSHGATVICQLSPWQFDPAKPMNLKRTFRRSSFLLTRLLCNIGTESGSPILDDAVKPVAASEHRWLDGLYLDVPVDWGDPYRFFGW